MTYMIFTQMLCTPDALVESVVHVRPNHEPLLSRPLTVHQAWLCYRKFAYSVFVDVYKSGQLLSSDSMALGNQIRPRPISWAFGSSSR